MVLEIKGTKLERVHFDNAITLHFGEKLEHQIRIEREFTIDSSDGSVEVSFIPTSGGGHTTPRGSDAVVDLISKKVQDAFAEDDGSLHIKFDDNRTLLVSFGKYEAWTYASPKGVLVSLPGGGLG